MAEGTGEEAGEVVTCPSCGQEVKQHSMIPVLPAGADAGAGPAYLCVACARPLIVTQDTAGPAAAGPAAAESAEPEPAAPAS